MTVRIVTDSTADIPSELAQELDIAVVPLYVIMRGRSYRAGIDISHDDVYKKVEEGDTPITTSQPSPADFAQTYKSVLKEADNIIAIQCSSRLSGTYQSALQGRELTGDKGHIEVIDSKIISMGLGIIAIAAARLAKTGATVSSVLEETQKAVSQSHIWGIFDTLKYLVRGGRLNKVSSLLGGVLNVKPLLTIKDGSIRPMGVVRTRAKGLEKILNNVCKFKNIQGFGIAHSSSQDEVNKLKAKLSALVDKNHIYTSQLGPSLGVHGGPGVLVLGMLASDTPKNAAEIALEKTRKRMPRLPSFGSPKLNFSPAP